MILQGTFVLTSCSTMGRQMVHFKNIQELLPWHTVAPRRWWGSKDTERTWKTSGDMCRNGQTKERFIQIQIPLKMMGSKRCHEICIPHALCCRGDLHFRHADLAHSRSLCKSVVQATLSGCLAFKSAIFRVWCFWLWHAASPISLSKELPW